MRIAFSLALAVLVFDAIPSLAQAPLDTAKIEQAIGVKGIFLPGTAMQEIVEFINGHVRTRV